MISILFAGFFGLAAMANPPLTVKVDSFVSSEFCAVVATVVESPSVEKVLTPNDLNITHEKRLHLLVYDPALKEFQHVHPEHSHVSIS